MELRRKSTCVELPRVFSCNKAGSASASISSFPKGFTSLIELIENLRRESLIRQQQCKRSWAKWGDENTSHFHRAATNKRQSRAMRGLNINGVWEDNQSLLLQEAFTHFNSEFKETAKSSWSVNMQGLPQLPPAEQQLLNSAITDAEIHEAVFCSGEDRCPGPDGKNNEI